MAQRAVRDTYGYESVGYGVERRLRIIAGQVVPPHLRLEDPTAVIDELGVNNPFYNLAIQPVVADPTPAPEAAHVVKRGPGRPRKSEDAAA